MKRHVKAFGQGPSQRSDDLWDKRADRLGRAPPRRSAYGLHQLLKQLVQESGGVRTSSRRSRHLPPPLPLSVGVGLRRRAGTRAWVGRRRSRSCGSEGGGSTRLPFRILEGRLAVLLLRMSQASGPAQCRQGYNLSMSVTRPKSTDSPKASPPTVKREDLARGLPGTDRERAEQRRRFAEEHRETLRRLGK
jgi:hypothetical protein